MKCSKKTELLLWGAIPIFSESRRRTNNGSGLVFPISPKYLVFLAKGDEGINVVDHRFADAETVKKFNRIINAHKTEIPYEVSL